MKQRAPLRRIVALFGAYIIALQAMLIPLSVAAAAPFDNSICGAIAADPSEPARGHDSSGLCAAGCAMHCCVQTLISPPVETFVSARVWVRVSLTAVMFAPASRPAMAGPHLARAPPA
jgi:hypothetical protein